MLWQHGTSPGTGSLEGTHRRMAPLTVRGGSHRSTRRPPVYRVRRQSPVDGTRLGSGERIQGRGTTSKIPSVLCTGFARCAGKLPSSRRSSHRGWVGQSNGERPEPRRRWWPPSRWLTRPTRSEPGTGKRTRVHSRLFQSQRAGASPRECRVLARGGPPPACGWLRAVPSRAKSHGCGMGVRDSGFPSPGDLPVPSP